MQTTPATHHGIQHEVLARHLAEVAPSEEALTSSGSGLGCAVEAKQGKQSRLTKNTLLQVIPTMKFQGIYLDFRHIF